MNSTKLTLVVLSFVLLLGAMLVRTSPLAGQSRSGDPIVVTDADTIREEATVRSIPLEESIDGVGMRVVLRFVNTLQEYGLVEVPPELENQLDAVMPRIVLRFVNTRQEYALNAIPSGLETLLENVDDRIVLRFVNSRREEQLTFPCGLFDDSSPPQLVGEPVISQAGGSPTVQWTTNEPSSSNLEYGTQPGNYSDTILDPLLRTEHAVSFSGTHGTTYYFRFTSTDGCGNTFTSQEYSIEIAKEDNMLYLPTILMSEE